MFLGEQGGDPRQILSFSLPPDGMKGPPSGIEGPPSDMIFPPSGISSQILKTAGNLIEWKEDNYGLFLGFFDGNILVTDGEYSLPDPQAHEGYKYSPRSRFSRYPSAIHCSPEHRIRLSPLSRDFTPVIPQKSVGLVRFSSSRFEVRLLAICLVVSRFYASFFSVYVFLFRCSVGSVSASSRSNFVLNF